MLPVTEENTHKKYETFNRFVEALLWVFFSLLSASSAWAQADYTVWRPSKGYWYSNDGKGHSLSRQWGAPTDIPVVGDYDGDGNSDIAVWRPSTGTWYIQGSNGQVVARQWGASGDIPVPGDYDGDGKTDIAVWRPSTGYWYIIQSSNGQVVARQWGASGDMPVPGDHDGDGKSDIAVWRPSTGYWYIIQSSNGQVISRQWGQSGDMPVPGDFDGDGKSDIAVWRPSNGTWYIVQSNNGQVVSRQWGQSGDTPVARDFDADGKTDIGVWRPSSGYWYITNSSNNQAVTQQWGESGDVAASLTSKNVGGGSPVVLELLPKTAGFTLATDSNGGVHLAGVVLGTGGQYVLVYQECASSCDSAGSWKTLVFTDLESSSSYIPTIGLTQDGRPRILYYSDSSETYNYVECSASCVTEGNWSGVELIQANPPPMPAPQPHLPFGVSPAGKAAFSLTMANQQTTFDNVYVFYCDANCGAGTSWTLLDVGPGIRSGSVPYAVAFGSDESVQVVAQEPTTNGSHLVQLVMHECEGSCANVGSWTEVDGLWIGHDDADFPIPDLARTPADGSRLAVYAEDPQSAQFSNSKILAYLGCNSHCDTLTNWATAVPVPVTGNVADIGFRLALDGSGQPTLAYASSTSVGSATCVQGDCTTPSGRWSVATNLTFSALDTAFPPPVPATCTNASWQLYVGPALALDAGARPILGITALAYALGGECDSEQTAIEAGGFVSLR